MAYGDAREGNWRGNWRMEWVASTLDTTSDQGVSSITTADEYTSAASSRLNWRPAADLNGLVRFAERRILVSVRVPSHFKHSLLKRYHVSFDWTYSSVCTGSPSNSSELFFITLYHNPPPPQPECFKAFHIVLTYSMVQSLSWEANWFAASQEIPRISRNPKVHCRTHKRSPTVSILGQPNPVHIPTSHLLEIHPNIIHPSTPRYPQWSLSLRFPHQDPIHPIHRATW